MNRRLKSGETVYCRYTGEVLTVIESDGVIVIALDSKGKETGRIIGDIVRRAA